MTLTQPLHDHHQHCDDLFAVAEAAALAKHWPDCELSFERFGGEMEAHFDTEEEILFPAFEAASGMPSGPTRMMCLEHHQMRELLGQMREALSARDSATFAGAAETLLILMRQHNLKVENILYPMCDRILADANVSIQDGLRVRVEHACPR